MDFLSRLAPTVHIRDSNFGCSNGLERTHNPNLQNTGERKVWPIQPSNMVEECPIFGKDNFKFELNSKGTNLQFMLNKDGNFVGITYMPTEDEQKLIDNAKNPENPNCHPTAGSCFPYSYTRNKETFGHMDTRTGGERGPLKMPSWSYGSLIWRTACRPPNGASAA